MDIYRIKTTAWEEEDFHILSDLSPSEIKKAIEPIVLAERNRKENDEEAYYDNDMLISALKEKYPNNLIEHYNLDFDTITI